ncbi:E3 ubiquitin-protein ligase RING1-like [Platanthera guangdongensis]|uniref:E3 ubiquitin-protein ligase RING1-like n=1 Tax=Platanthera guangdongensis TaxID=2320717 RepID=A0ABR2MAR9_9ASPA
MRQNCGGSVDSPTRHSPPFFFSMFNHGGRRPYNRSAHNISFHRNHKKSATRQSLPLTLIIPLHSPASTPPHIHLQKIPNPHCVCMVMDSAAGESIMAALLRLNPARAPPLHSLAVDLRLRQSRLCFLLTCPPQFSLTISHLRSLSFAGKTLLLSRLLLRSLSLLLSPLNRPDRLRLRDFDAAILLLAMCDAYDPSAAVPADRCIDWRAMISRRLASATLRPTGLGVGWWPVLAPHLDAAAKCRRLAESARDPEKAGGAASAASVMSLAVAEAGECAICGEEIAGGGAMPCGHPFHWRCILEWLRMRNTCPCCRFELPTADVYDEIDRVWKSATGKISSTPQKRPKSQSRSPITYRRRRSRSFSPVRYSRDPTAAASPPASSTTPAAQRSRLMPCELEIFSVVEAWARRRGRGCAGVTRRLGEEALAAMAALARRLGEEEADRSGESKKTMAV